MGKLRPLLSASINILPLPSRACRLNHTNIHIHDSFILHKMSISYRKFSRIMFKWLPEIRKDDKLKAIPLILVATKCDQFEDQDLFNSRSDSDMNLGLPGGTEGNLNEKKEGDAPAGDAKSSSVSKETAESIAQFEGLTKYVETSSLFGEGVKNVFDEAIHAILKDQSKYNKELLAGLKEGVQKGKKGGGPDGDKKCLIF